MVGWMELLAVLAEQFVRTPARDAFHDILRALAVTVALFGAPSTPTSSITCQTSMGK